MELMTASAASAAANPSEGVDETVSLSDRFGLWIGFHNCSQDDYLEMVRAYAAHYGLPIADEALTRVALAWAIGRGARSGRVAFQFIQDLAGRLGVRLDGD
jgi:predicted AAA+ superfamily ATPase